MEAGVTEERLAGRAVVQSSRLALFLGLATVGCAADLLTKQLVFARLGPPPSPIYWILPEIFGFETSVNHGALFGMGQGMVPVFAGISLLAMLALGIWVLRGGALQSLLLTIALGMILGGILGNLYDRLGFWGHAGVRDWIRFSYRGWDLAQFQYCRQSVSLRRSPVDVAFLARRITCEVGRE